MNARRSKARWTTLDWAASFTLSAFWHLLALAVLTLTVHPFQLPDFSQPINLELLPRITLPEMPTVQLQLKPRPKEEAPTARARIRPQTQVLPKTVQVQPQAAPPRQLLDVARPQPSEVEKPLEVERRAVQAPRLQTQQAVPQIPEAPPEPVQVTRPAPALSRPLELPRAQAEGQARALSTSRAPVAVPQAAAPQAAVPQAAAPAAEAPIATAPPQAAPAQAAPALAAPEAPAAPSVQVLTNQNVIQAPVEIRPRERAASAPGLSSAAPGAAEIPAAPGAQAGGLPPAGGFGGGQPGGRSGPAGVNGINGGFGSRGLRMTLGCENPDTYKLTPDERAACLQRFAQRGRAAPDLGLNIPTAKQVEYDHYEACHRAIMDASIPGANSPSDGTSIRGLGANPSLKDCGPSTR